MQGAPSSSRTAFHLSAEREHFWHGSAGFHDRAIGHCTGCALTQRTIAGNVDRDRRGLKPRRPSRNQITFAAGVFGFRETGPNLPRSMLDSPSGGRLLDSGDDQEGDSALDAIHLPTPLR